MLGLAESLKHAGQGHAALTCTGRALGPFGVDVPCPAGAERAHALLLTDDMTVGDAAAA